MSRQRQEDRQDTFEVLVGGAFYLALLAVIVGLGLVFGEQHLGTIVFGVWAVLMALCGWLGWREMQRNE